MDIGGYDTPFRIPQHTNANRLICMVIDSIKKWWPALSYIDIPVTSDHEGEYREAFFYKDLYTRETWDRYGATRSNEAHMIHIVIEPNYLTVVTDNPADEPAASILADIQQEIRSLSTP